MTTINQELYEALLAAGAPDDVAKRAAATVYEKDQKTKLDLKEIEYRLTLRLGALMAFAVSAVAALVKLL